MHLLLPDPSDAVDVYEHYARDWLDHGGIRGNMIASVDGSAAADGLSAGLQTPGDNRIFTALRDLADVVLVGWRTAQLEGYRPARVDDARLERRGAHGLGPALPIAVVSRSLRIDPDASLFADPGNGPLVVTCASSDPAARAALAGRAEVLICGDGDIDYAAVRSQFADRGLRRVLCEGGPTILGQVALADELDELCLSVTPLLAGPVAGRIVAGTAWPGGVPRGLRLHSVLEEDGALFTRYLRA